ncbi:uncharacterized protein N7525_002805 [Penicillium rubens]|uniref:uncharacterized protein n=1 Tax=Penicillium rubens TaxID=1108849 RepID=UPI002A5ADCAC|nr:uncharacterized protein N7525_002805 [Penicillium rubens]KAJ5837617.1 hypothetical protein N7525_002805 [Penicillium rubens]
MRLETPSVLGLAASALWSARGKRFVGGYEAGCSTLENGMESVMVSTDGVNNVTLSTGSNCNPLIPSGVTDLCVNAAIRSFLSF